MTTGPLVSVVMPVYDRERCVAEAVASVLGQTYPNLECLVVDDGSTDGSLEVLDATFSDDPRVQVFAREHRGVSAARNYGIAQATGQYLTFLDSDDLMLDRRVERQLAFLHEAEVDAVLCREQQVVVGDATRPAWMERLPEWSDGYYHMSVLLATDWARQVGGFDEGMTVGEDVDFVIKLVGAGARLGKLDERLLVRRFLGDNLSHQVNDDVRETLRAIRRHRTRSRAARESGTSA